MNGDPTPQPYVTCERCRQPKPPGDLHPCGPGGRWRYCSRCVNEAEGRTTGGTLSSKTMLGVNPRELHSWRTAECGGACERVYKADEVDAEIERLREALERIDAHLEVRPDSELGQLQVISHNHSFGFWLALKAAREVLRNERKPFETSDDLTDGQRLDFIQEWLHISEGQGFKWDTFALDTDTPVREQIDRRILAGMAAVLKQQDAVKANEPVTLNSCDHRRGADDTGEFCSTCGERVPPKANEGAS